MKKLHSQKALLERDICKRDSLAGRRRESCVNRPKAVDSKKTRGQDNIMQQTLQVKEVLMCQLNNFAADVFKLLLLKF